MPVAEGGFQLDFRTAQGERSMVAASCDELASAAALLLGLLRDSQAEPEPAPEPGAVLSTLLGASLALDLGSLPRLVAGPMLSLGIRLYATSLTLTGLYLPTQDIDARGASGVVGEVRLAAAGLGVCQSFTRTLELGACAHFEYGRLWGRGEGFALPHAVQSDWALLLVGARIATEVAPRLHVLLELLAGPPWMRVAYSATPLGKVSEPPAIIGRALLGIEARL